MADLHVAWSSEFPGSDTQDEIRTAVESLIRELAGEGAIVEQSMPEVNLIHQYKLGEELFDLLAGTFPEEPTAFRRKRA